MKQFEEFVLDDWVEYTQKQHWRTIELKLDRIRDVWANMDGSKPNFVITVAGTNGKGSSVSMLDAVLLQAGKKTGAYTSPHLVRYNERIKINGVPVSDEEICLGFCAIEKARKSIPLTYFEFGTLCALWVFIRNNVDIAILEVGMGGRLDAVNMIENDIALITTIDIDHQQWLGTDKEKIGAEKAGIIKPGGLVVCADPEAPVSIGETASRVGATLFQVGVDFVVEDRHDGISWSCNDSALSNEWKHVEQINLPLTGKYQIRNFAGVLAVLALIEKRIGVTTDDLRLALQSVNIPGRCQVVSKEPELIIDVAHNRQSATELAKFLALRPHTNSQSGKTLVVLGVLADKALKEIIGEIMGSVDIWYLATLGGDRGQSAADLLRKLAQVNREISPHRVLKAAIFDSPVEAYNAAMSDAAKTDRVVVFGSFYTVGDIMKHTNMLTT
ncbi:MAG: bifunctional tetrahydrofolate synthase/dihydrofolate synthase [Gammaproteobacteria bacterium]|nr:bifunctional tetrahydrofolate synthase/dihydrofolate synthase [Gammaproteobacteria bacterium]